MEIKETQEEGTVVLTLSGQIDERGAEKLKEKFSSLKKTKPEAVLMNFTNVSHIGSAGIGKLLLLYKDVAIYGGKIIITGLSPELKSIFVNLKLDTVFTIN